MSGWGYEVLGDGALRFSWEIVVPQPREVVWQYVADTDRVNQIAGVFDVAYDYDPQGSGGSIIYASAQRFGIKIRWIEHPAQWVQPEWFEFTREYLGGPMAKLVSRCTLVAVDEDNTRIRQNVDVHPKGVFGKLLAMFAVGVDTRRGFLSAYRQIDTWARHRAFFKVPEGAVSRHELGAKERDAVDKLCRVGASAGFEATAKAVAPFVLSLPPRELVRLRPYAIADEVEQPRKDVLRFFLHAAKAGLLELHWDVICPSCRRPKQAISNLSELRHEGYCPTCNVDFNIEFDRLVEAKFSTLPLGLGEDAVEYCHLGPMNTPHRLGAVRVEPGEEATLEVLVEEPGAYRLVCPQSGTGYVEVREGGSVPGSVVQLTSDGLEGLPESLTTGAQRLEIRNGLDAAADVSLERTRWLDNLVTAAEITLMEEFRRLFSTQVLEPGVGFSIRNLYFLFSDVVDSTAMYADIGDGPAFALVQEHFEVLQEIYTRNGGRLVKTIGDAIMAVFSKPEQALGAALDMHAAVRDLTDESTGKRISLRIGLHGGPCIAMEANGVLDYFGQTVNTSARVESRAEAHEVAFTDALIQSEDVQKLLGERGLMVRDELATLKGLGEAIRVYRVIVE